MLGYSVSLDIIGSEKWTVFLEGCELQAYVRTKWRLLFIGSSGSEPYTHRKEKETHELTITWLSWLAVFLVGRKHEGDGAVAQHGSQTRNNRLTETCSLGLTCSSLILNNWHLSKQGVCRPVSSDHIASLVYSSSRLLDRGLMSG